MKTTAVENRSGTTENMREEEPRVSGRRGMRYPIPALVTFRWSSRMGMQRQGKGKSRNISEGGAFVVARDLPPVGANICLSFELPDAEASGRFPFMEMTGEVARVELPLTRKSAWGFAVTADKAILRGSCGDNEVAASIH